jgi:hypothetical protein
MFAWRFGGRLLSDMIILDIGCQLQLLRCILGVYVRHIDKAARDSHERAPCLLRDIL